VCDRISLAHDDFKALEGPVGLRILAHAPDARKRDLDNTMKALLDALQAAGVYTDDSQICDIHISRRRIIRPDGMVIVTAKEVAYED